MSTTPLDATSEAAVGDAGETGGGQGENNGGALTEDEEGTQAREVADRLGRLRVANHDPSAPQLNSVAGKTTAAPPEEQTTARHAVAAADVCRDDKTLHAVSAAAAAAFTEAGYAASADLKLCMRQHLCATDNRDGFAETLQKFGVACAGRSTVGIAVVETTECAAQAWLFEVEGGDDAALRAVLTSDAQPPSLLLRQVNVQEDYLARHAHGSAIGIDPSEGVSGIRLPDGEEVPRVQLTGGS